MTPLFISERATVASFLEVWKSNLKTAATVREAYELTEERHEAVYGARRFAEFSSFARARRNYLARRHRPGR